MSQLEIKRTIQRVTNGIKEFSLVVKPGTIEVIIDNNIISSIGYIVVNNEDLQYLYRYLCRYNYIINASQITLQI